MKQSGYDPRRRNRSIGTAKQGHGNENTMKIPERWPENRVFFENLKNPIHLRKEIHEREISIILEPPKPPFVYACTVEDVVYLLNQLPPEVTDMLDLFVFRHPTRKERLLSKVWGRLVYFANVGTCSGTAIYLESQEPGGTLKWNKSSNPRQDEELERLRNDGHAIEILKRHIEIRMTLNSIRNTQLYRTILHELGHLEDCLSDESYVTKTSHDKEMFAHRFAERLALELRGKSLLPFERIFHEQNIIADQLRPQYFCAEG